MFSRRPVFFLVRFSASISVSRCFSGSPPLSPRIRIRTFFASSSSISEAKKSRISCISAATSSSDRLQFSVEKAYRLSAPMPRSSVWRIISRRVSVPWRCPLDTLSLCFFAQRPFPSMMMATCFGSRSNSSDVRGGFFSARDNAVFSFILFPLYRPAGIRLPAVGIQPWLTDIFYHISRFLSLTYRSSRHE